MQWGTRWGMASVARHYQRAKNGVHALQALMVFIGAVITIAIYAKGGQDGGRINYYFVLCWLCVPALIYQTAFPIFQRTKRFANAYAHAIVDLIYTIFWFSAFIAVVVWVRDGSHAAKDWDSKASLCDKFAWGPTSKCKLGQAAGALAAIICILFVLTSAFSVYGVSYFRRNGSLPGYATKNPEPIHEENPEDYAFSSNPRDQPEEHDEREPMHHEHDELPSIHYEHVDEERQTMHREEDYEVSTLHTGPDDNFDRESLISRDRQPTPDLPMHREPPLNWHRPPTPEMTLQRERATSWDRPQTPELPVGEGFYPVDTSYHGSGRAPYSPPQKHRSSESSDAGLPSPLRIPVPPKESNFIEDLEPEVYDPPQSSGAGSLSPLHVPNFDHRPGAGPSRPPLNAVATGESIFLVGRKPIPQRTRSEAWGSEIAPEWMYPDDDVESRRPSTRRRRIDSFKADNKFEWERSSFGSEDRILFPDAEYGR